MQKFFSVLPVCAILFLTPFLSAQDLQQTLSNLTSDAASAYVAPIVSGFGGDLNTGWVTKVTPAKTLGFDFDFRIIAMGTFFTDPNKTFNTQASFRFNTDEANILTSGITNSSARNQIINQIITQDFTVKINGPTIVGNKSDSVHVFFPGKTFSTTAGNYTVPAQNVGTPVQGFLGDLPAMPLAVPQFTFGTVYGSSVSIRVLPSIQLNSDLGKFSYFGIGIQHNPAVWLPNPVPLDFSVGFFYQRMKVGDTFDSKATIFNINASRTFGTGALSVTPYVGVGFESSTITVKYNQLIDTPVGPEPVKVQFDLNGENSTRFVIGSSFGLGPININVDYNISKYNTVSAGLGFGI